MLSERFMNTQTVDQCKYSQNLLGISCCAFGRWRIRWAIDSGVLSRAEHSHASVLRFVNIWCKNRKLLVEKVLFNAMSNSYLYSNMGASDAKQGILREGIVLSRGLVQRL